MDQYDSDGQYPFYGFGAIPSFMGVSNVSYCFPLNGNARDPHIAGVNNVIATYKQRVSQVQMMGPTKFAPIIQQFRRLVEDCKDSKMYFVAMIVTDGEIHDMAETITEIAYLSKNNLPISFVIIGVGNEDFSNMVRLDGDELAIEAGAHDIVQFVKYEEVIKRSKPGEVEQNLA